MGDKVKGEIEKLSEFKGRIDKIITGLGKSKASPDKIGDQEISRAAFGGAFAEGDDIFTQYSRVHTQLVTLSKNLGDLIEAMRTAVHGAETDWRGIEADAWHRFWKIQNKLVQDDQPKKELADDKRVIY